MIFLIWISLAFADVHPGEWETKGAFETYIWFQNGGGFLNIGLPKYSYDFCTNFGDSKHCYSCRPGRVVVSGNYLDGDIPVCVNPKTLKFSHAIEGLNKGYLR